MKTTKKIFAAVLAVMMIALMIPFSVSAATELTVTCNPNADGITGTKADYKGTYSYEFYKLASVVTNTGTVTVEADYASNTALAEAIKSTNSDKSQQIIDICAGLTWDSTKAAKTVTFEYDGTADVPTQKITGLEDGIYYVYCAKKPGTVKSVAGSLISLPFYNGTDWVYSDETVNLASKINVSGINVSKTAEVNKVGTLTNAEYTLKASVAGSATNKIATYAIVDNMDAALKLVDSSVKVYYVLDGEDVVANASDYEVVKNYGYTDNGAAKTATFAVVLKNSVLNTDTFYSYSDVKVTFSASVNADIAEKVKSDITNTDGLYYGNVGNLTYKPGNTVNVATAGINVTKVDGNTPATKVAGAEFTLYYDRACTNAVAVKVGNEVVKAVSTANGSDKFYYGNNEFYFTPDVTYYVKETKAPANYNLNSTVYTVKAVAKQYTQVGESLGGSVVVPDYPVTVPQTGGVGTMMFYVGGAALVACAGVLLFVLKRKKAAK